MYDTHKIVRFANGDYVFRLRKYTSDIITNNEEVVAVRDEEHGDWKTALIRNISGIKAGEKARLVGMFSNMYGQWATIALEDRRIDVRPSNLIISKNGSE